MYTQHFLVYYDKLQKASYFSEPATPPSPSSMRLAYSSHKARRFSAAAEHLFLWGAGEML